LVRPDQFIAFRHAEPAVDAKAKLSSALEAVLGKALSSAGSETGPSNSRVSDW
jgi:hypothetical protein